MKASKNVSPRSIEDDEDEYIRETCRELDTVYDRAAVRLLCTVGIFAVDDPAQLDLLIDELANEPNDVSERMAAVQERTVHGDTIAARHTAICEYETLEAERQERHVEAAYLLGMAVGRRLGPGALRLPGGAR